MLYDQNSFVTLQYLLEDLNDLEDQQKGKQAAGKRNDLEIAIMYMREDIMAMQTSIKDGALALSTSTAVATDQNLLAAIKNYENIAVQDRHFALAVSNGELTAHEMPTMREMGQTDQNDDTVSVVMSDLMSRITMSDNPTNGEGSSRSRLLSQRPSVEKECVSCLEKFQITLFTSSCGHEFCRDCIREMFLGAIKDEELYPPRCCGEVVPPGVALRILNYEELRAFSDRAIEWTAKDRLYCAERTCSKFIPPSAIQNELGDCSNCNQQTHLTCRSFAHPGVDCPMDEALHGILEMADDKNWKRCFHCRTMVELEHGCNHITCRYESMTSGF